METINREFLPVNNRSDFEKILISASIIYNNPESKGLVWRPYGMSMMNKFSSFLRELFPKFGFQEHVFPFLADVKNFNKLNQEICEFDKGVFKFNKIILRPSGEIVIYPIFKDWIKTINDLPLKVFQIGMMFRDGRKSGIFRTNEVNFFVEGHSAHASRREVEEQIVSSDLLIDQALNFFGLPVIKGERPIWTNKPVAERTFGYDAILPNGETALAASNYAQMQIFSKVFKVGFMDEQSNYDYTYQSTLGFSFRPLLFSLWLLSDQYGLRLLPSLAPVKIAILEINLDNDQNISGLVKQVKEKLTNSQISFVHDMEYKLPLSKRFSKYELLGVPLRIEIGQKEIDSGFLKAKRRDNFLSEEIKFLNLENDANLIFEKIETNLRLQLLNIFNRFQVTAKNYLEVRECLSDGKVAKLGICYCPECINGLQTTVGYGELLSVKKVSEGKTCVYCNKATDYQGWYSRRI